MGNAQQFPTVTAAHEDSRRRWLCENCGATRFVNIRRNNKFIGDIQKMYCRNCKSSMEHRYVSITRYGHSFDKFGVKPQYNE